MDSININSGECLDQEFGSIGRTRGLGTPLGINDFESALATAILPNENRNIHSASRASRLFFLRLPLVNTEAGVGGKANPLPPAIINLVAEESSDVDSVVFGNKK